MNASTLTSLCPGFKQVDTFEPDGHYVDEEITYVTLDLGNIEPTLVPSSTTYRLIGLDTLTPFLQLSGTILKGQHDILLGTELLFADGKDPHDKSRRSVNHIASTEQRIRFNEVRLQPKSNGRQREEGLSAGKGDTQMVDRVTGKIAPRTRAHRTRGDGSKSISKGKGGGRAKTLTPDDNGDESSNVGGPMELCED
ncbi:hypothetical protein BDZ94DRAFT_1271591 [Collybia nuda]|uniref:Transcription factor TFIIIC triple barrel domain-containing protein n=1 Tax=Collybia nuda TaxID=64659 RepID=A0A9P5XUZ4_9AGAR|nr:hypothetical protein BDZ94DRAFT_1271591 [Collybia nuda]